jgi:hypothetical protein
MSRQRLETLVREMVESFVHSLVYTGLIACLRTYRFGMAVFESSLAYMQCSSAALSQGLEIAQLG